MIQQNYMSSPTNAVSDWQDRQYPPQKLPVDYPDNYNNPQLHQTQPLQPQYMAGYLGQPNL